MKQRAIPLETETPERETATAGCTVSSTSVSSLLANSFYDKRWFKTASVLRTDPSLMTSKLLIVALKNKAPLHVIKFFIRVNPEAAGIPKEGPTPLQVAVQYNASKEVVQELLQACPFALVVTTNAEWLDPLTYARRFRSSEIELIALLSRPLGSWIHPKEREEEERKASRAKKSSSPPIIPLALTSESLPTMLPKVHLREPVNQDRSLRFSAIEKQELQNVKKLCLAVMKGQKKLVREVGRVKDSVENTSSTAEAATAAQQKAAARQVTIEQIRGVEEMQKQNLKAHLIALDMKEQAMRAYVRRMEEKIMRSLEETKNQYINERHKYSFEKNRDELRTAVHRMDNAVGSLEHRMADYEVRTTHEARVNAHFRSDLEQHLGIVQHDVSRQEGFEIISVVENTPFVFATPYREPIIEEMVPLYPTRIPPQDKPPGTCMWPQFLSRRRGNKPR